VYAEINKSQEWNETWYNTSNMAISDFLYYLQKKKKKRWVHT